MCDISLEKACVHRDGMSAAWLTHCGHERDEEVEIITDNVIYEHISLLPLETCLNEESHSASAELAAKSKVCLRARPWREPCCRPAPWTTSTMTWWVCGSHFYSLSPTDRDDTGNSSWSWLCLFLQVEEATVVMEDDSPVEPASTADTQRNLSAWSITIPYIDFCDDEAKREKIPVFCIDVERNDRKEGERAVRDGLHSMLEDEQRFR